MKNLLLLLILISISACSSSILDQPYRETMYERLDYERLLKSEEVSDADLFMLNYTIVRQRDYFNYTIKGKKFGEILEEARNYSKNGFPLNLKLNDNGKQDRIKQSITMEGKSQMPHPKKAKRTLVALKFSCKYENPSDKDIVMMNSSFILNGPFGDYITTINYELNCIIPANGVTHINFVVPAKTISNNLKYEGDPNIQRLGIDNILNTCEAVPSGMDLQDDGKYFKDCFFNAASLAPHVIIDFKKSLKDKEWKTQNPDGTYTLDLGNMHIPDSSDEVIKMQ